MKTDEMAKLEKASEALVYKAGEASLNGNDYLRLAEYFLTELDYEAGTHMDADANEAWLRAVGQRIIERLTTGRW